MEKTNPQDEPQDGVAPSKIPELPTHPALSCWDINRKLKKLEKNYRDDQEKRPTEIERSTVGNPRCAAIFWRVERLEQYLDEIKAVYEKEIESGRFADTPDLWAAVYAVKILPSVAAKINSLGWNLAHKIWLTGGDGPGERGTVGEAHRRLNQLRASLESELARAISHADTASVEECDDTAAKLASGTAQARQAFVGVSSSPSRVLKLRSSLRKAVFAYLQEHRDASDKEIKGWLRDSNPSVVPKRWNMDDSLAGKTFTKVRALIKLHHDQPQDVSTTITRQSSTALPL